MQNSQVCWQVETQGQIYEADFEELKQWIAEGAVISTDKVKRGNLRWLPVEKVPDLYNYFNSNNFNYSPADVLFANSFAVAGETDQTQPVPENSTEEAIWEIDGEKVCYLHKNSEALYACAICKKLFCKICPDNYGGSVKICPLCGSLCRSANEPIDVHKLIGAVNKPYYKFDETFNRSERKNRIGFKISDFPKAFSYSLQYIKGLVLKMISFIFARLLKIRR